MIVTVQFLGRVEMLTKMKQEGVQLKEGSTLLDLFAVLAEEHGARFKGEIFDPAMGLLRSEFVAMVNRKILEDPATPLKEGDIVVLMPVMSGG